MITSEIVRLLARKVPNYHVCSAKFVKGHFSICPCAACESSVKGKSVGGKVQYSCGRVIKDLAELEAIGHALVSALGTCDAAKFVQEKFDDFKLEGVRVDLPPQAAPDVGDAAPDESVVEQTGADVAPVDAPEPAEAEGGDQ